MTLSRTLPLYLPIVEHLALNSAFATSFAKAYDQSQCLVKAHPSRYSLVLVPAPVTISLFQPQGQLIDLLLSVPPRAPNDPTVQDLVREIASKMIATH